MSVALAVCEVMSDVVVVVTCIAMVLVVGLASFMTILGTGGCDMVAVVVAVAGVTGVLTIMATAVVVTVT